MSNDAQGESLIEAGRVDAHGGLSLEAKAALLGGVDMWHSASVADAGIGPIVFTDGPAGARGEAFGDGRPSASFPCGAALGASWDVELVEEVGKHLGLETRRAGADVLLAPTVNLQRTAVGGRNFECFSEDPVLTARLAVRYITGVQSTGVGAVVKHLVANDAEVERMTVSSEVDERTLREVYLLPFEAACDAGVWGVMAAYNKLNGTHCTEDPWLLTTVLRDEWGWDGVVVSDWWAVHTTEDAIRAGLDLEMPGPPTYYGRALAEAVRSGAVDAAIVDTSVTRVLGGRARLGDRPSAGVDQPHPSEATLALIRRAAAESMVLLRNDGVLPLERSSSASVAVIGPNADSLSFQGGGSAAVFPHAVVSPLAGIRAALGDAAEVRYEAGVTPARSRKLDPRSWRTPDGADGLSLEYFDNADRSGVPIAKTSFRFGTVLWAGRPVHIGEGPWSARATGVFEPTRTGPHHLTVRAVGHIRLHVGGEVVGESDAEGSLGRVTAEVDLEAGVEVHVVIEFVPGSAVGPFSFLDVRCDEPAVDDALGRAVRAAAASDVAVVVVGLGEEDEREGVDRATLDLPDGQIDLIRAVVAANPRTIVVVNAGAPLDLGWADEVAAVLWAWYPGQEGGAAIADVLFGDVDPSGRLPFTLPISLGDTPCADTYPPVGGKLVYSEGVLVGHRHYDVNGIAPRFPFGFGSSYATFDLDDLEIEGGIDDLVVSCTIRNRSERAGSEVVQLYIGSTDEPAPRPVRRLVAFEKVRLQPGDACGVRFALGARDLARWDSPGSRWAAEPGSYVVSVGRSSRDLPLEATVSLRPSGLVSEA